MASAQPENGASSPSGEEEDFGYGHFPDRRQKPKFAFNQAFTHNGRCQGMMKVALDTNPYAKLLLDAMKNSGCTVYRDRHFSCENCDGRVSGGFDSLTSQIVLCQNNIRRQSQMNRVVVHELIHAFDHCRAQVDWFHNMKHLACSEIRAANLSGDCSLLNEISRLKFGLRQHHQTCVRDRAVRSILTVRKVSKDIAEKVVDEVFDSCFNDQEPFGRVPYSTSEAKYVYRDFRNRGRYYTNL